MQLTQVNTSPNPSQANSTAPIQAIQTQAAHRMRFREKNPKAIHAIAYRTISVDDSSAICASQPEIEDIFGTKDRSNFCCLYGACRLHGAGRSRDTLERWAPRRPPADIAP
jgi:hypothetical protein